jgi:hypothetical protein
VKIGMSLGWVAAAAVLPLLAALVVAWPFWRIRVRDEMGTILGAFVVFTCFVLFVGREYVEIDRTTAYCVERQIACRFDPKLFGRYAIYGAFAMAHVMVLFIVGLSVDEKLRKREREGQRKANSHRLEKPQSE